MAQDQLVHLAQQALALQAQLAQQVLQVLDQLVQLVYRDQLAIQDQLVREQLVQQVPQATLGPMAQDQLVHRV